MERCDWGGREREHGPVPFLKHTHTHTRTAGREREGVARLPGAGRNKLSLGREGRKVFFFLLFPNERKEISTPPGQ